MSKIVEEVFGLELSLRYSEEQLETSVSKGFIKKIKMSKENAALSAIYNPSLNNVLYFFPKGSRNADKTYHLARDYYRKNIEIQKN